MRDRLSLHVADESVGEGGRVATAWTTVGPLWGAVDAVQSRDGREGEADRAAAVWRIVIRYRADVAVGQRLVARGRTLAISAVEDPDGTRRWLVCRCAEIEP